MAPRPGREYPYQDGRARHEAWSAGYQTAVDTLRQMADEFDSEDMKSAIAVLVEHLEAIKP